MSLPRGTLSEQKIKGLDIVAVSEPSEIVKSSNFQHIDMIYTEIAAKAEASKVEYNNYASAEEQTDSEGLQPGTGYVVTEDEAI